ncbi:hypothetical protein [uncultured Thomasclavelia sp.]|uniref:hypothetical protein n=1 Tax=uncultured Thomasclavelia sp. TaxID=3025759 RepID=UPI0025D55E8E|nr:hypothetical protein [uncultured Thomasclavelia sp.]
MNNTVLQNLIYNQLYAAANYELIATIAPSNEIKTRLTNYASDCKNNASYLERIYQEENTSSYNPIIEKAQFHGNFVESIKWTLNYIGESNRLFFINSFYEIYTTSQRQILTYIAGILNNHAIGLTYISFTN